MDVEFGMVVLEFLIFVISSGLFCSQRFRGNLYAVLVAGGIATASSLLFVYDLGMRWTVHAEGTTPSLKVVREIVKVPVLQKISRPPSLSTSKDCADDYPFWARVWGNEGTTQLAYHIQADGTVNDVTVSQSSGSDRLDDAAVSCIRKWHYKPAIKDGELVDVPWTTSVAWLLDPKDSGKTENAPAKDETKPDAKEAASPPAP